MFLGAAGRIEGDWKAITLADLQQAASEKLSALNIVIDDPFEMDVGDVHRIREMFAYAAIQIGQTSGQYGSALINPNNHQRLSGIENVKRMCEITRLLGAPNTYLRPGSINPAHPWFPHKENRSPRIFDRLVDSTKKICSTAESEGVRLAVEGGVVSPLYSATIVRDFFDAVGSKSLGFNQDPVNFVSSLEDIYDTQQFLNNLFDVLGKFTIGAHIKDIRIVDQLVVRFEETEIGTGMMDHVTFLKLMQKSCPNAHVLIEHIKPDRFENAVKKIEYYSRRAGITWEINDILP